MTKLLYYGPDGAYYRKKIPKIHAKSFQIDEMIIIYFIVNNKCINCKKVEKISILSILVAKY